MNFMNHLLPGFRFCPTAEDLLLFYLPRRQNGELFDPFVQDVDIYGNEPWTLFDYNQQSVFYVFCDLKKIGKRVQRRAGSGTWMGQNNIDVKDQYDNIIGVDRYFNFKIKGGSHDDHGRWTMHEFALVDERGYPLDDKVVCVIGHNTQISTKQSVCVPKKRKGINYAWKPLRPLLEGGGIGVATEQIDGMLLSDQGNQLGEERQSMETSSPSSALIVSEPQSTEQIGGLHEFAFVDERGYPLDDEVVCVMGHDTQISTKQSVCVPKKRKGRMICQTHEETSTKRQCMETSSSSSDLVVSEEAQTGLYGGFGVATEQIDGLLLSDLFDPTHMFQGTQLSGEEKLMETSFPSSALIVSESQSTQQIDGSLRFDSFDGLQITHTSSLIPSEAEPQPYFEFDEEGELWVCLDRRNPKGM